MLCMYSGYIANYIQLLFYYYFMEILTSQLLMLGGPNSGRPVGHIVLGPRIQGSPSDSKLVITLFVLHCQCKASQLATLQTDACEYQEAIYALCYVFLQGSRHGMLRSLNCDTSFLHSSSQSVANRRYIILYLFWTESCVGLMRSRLLDQ